MMMATQLQEDGSTRGSARQASGKSYEGTEVVYKYAISAVLVTFRRTSGPKFIPAGRSRVIAGLPYTLMTLFLGWWGIPWGPLASIEAIYTNMRGGDLASKPSESVTDAPIRSVIWQPSHRAPSNGLSGWALPEVSGIPTATIPPGTTLRLSEVRGDWARVRTADGWSGWVDARQLELIPMEQR
jgi:hypothetical protein